MLCTEEFEPSITGNVLEQMATTMEHNASYIVCQIDAKLDSIKQINSRRKVKELADVVCSSNTLK